MIDTIFVPRGAEASAVRRALARTGSSARVVETGIGPRAAALAVEAALDGPPIARALITGLCGLLSPAYAVGDALAYGEIVPDPPDGLGACALARDFVADVAASIADVQSGVRAVAVDVVVTASAAKASLGARCDAQAVDMESLVIARRLQGAGANVAVVRVASDGVRDDLPDLHMALDGSGGLDAFALALAMLRRPLAGLWLARNGTRALAALETTIAAILS